MPRFTTFDGLSLHYEDDGAGMPLLCLSGLTRNVRDFDYVAPHLGDARLVRLDYRGRGRSDRADPATYTIPVEARDALALLDHLGLPRAAILGTSRGGLIAMVLAAMARDRLIGAALNDVGPEIAPAGMDAILDYLGKPPAFGTRDAAIEARARLLPGFEDVPRDRWASEVEHSYVETEDGLGLTYDPALRQAVEAGAAEPAADLWPLWDALAGLPTALIRGANSNILAPETAAEMRRRRPDLIYAEVPKRGHAPFLDEPEALDALTRWRDACRAAWNDPPPGATG